MLILHTLWLNLLSNLAQAACTMLPVLLRRNLLLSMVPGLRAKRARLTEMLLPSVWRRSTVLVWFGTTFYVPSSALRKISILGRHLRHANSIVSWSISTRLWITSSMDLLVTLGTNWSSQCSLTRTGALTGRISKAPPVDIWSSLVPTLSFPLLHFARSKGAKVSRRRKLKPSRWLWF